MFLQLTVLYGDDLDAIVIKSTGKRFDLNNHSFFQAKLK